jgi:hypothetical protein
MGFTRLLVGEIKDVVTILQAFSSVQGKLDGYNAF